jgi:hypothetical protein
MLRNALRRLNDRITSINNGVQHGGNERKKLFLEFTTQLLYSAELSAQN